MDTKKLRQKILDLAIHGKLVPQDSNDEPASVLLERIRTEKENLKIKRSKKSDSDTLENEEMPFAIPDSWEWTTLGNIGIWQSGATPSRLNKDYYGGEIPWLKTGDLNDGFIQEIPETITQKALEETSVKLNPTGSVLIAMYGATIGKVGILTCPATTNQACCACIEFQGVDQMYLFYFLLSHKDNFIMLGGGGAQPNISKEKIVDTLIPLPPIEEQKRIVTAIEQWFALIDILENEKSDLQASIQQAKSKILDLAIHGKLAPQDPNDEPAIDLLKRINPKFEGCEKEQHPYEIPKNWIWAKGMDIFEPMKSVSPTGESFNYIDIDAIDNKRNIVISAKKIKTKEAPSRASRYTEKGNVLFSMVRPYLRNIAMVGENECIASTGFFVCREKPYLNNSFCLYLMLSDYVVDGLNEHMKGDNSPSISKSQIESFLFPLPPYQEQLRIVSKIEELFAVLDSIKESLE